MRSLSMDLRVRIVASVESGEHSICELADLFFVNLATIVRLLQRYRALASAPGAWENTTLISGLRTSGLVAPFALPGATDRTTFEAYVKKMLVPKLQIGDMVISNNLSAHHSAAAVTALQAVGARREPLAVYRPDLTPMEEMSSNQNQGGVAHHLCPLDAAIDVMGKVLEKVTPTNNLD